MRIGAARSAQKVTRVIQSDISAKLTPEKLPARIYTRATRATNGTPALAPLFTEKRASALSPGCTPAYALWRLPGRG
jgi:hypothetical protein